MFRFAGAWVLVLVGGGLAGFGCGKSSEPDMETPGGVDTPPEVFSKTVFNPQVELIDPAGNPIADASVVFGTSSVRSKEDGIATLPEQAIDKTIVVTVKADGYAPTTKTLSSMNAYAPLTVELRKLVDHVVDSQTGGNVDLGDAAVTLAGRSFFLPDGTAYSGMVTVKAVTVFDPVTGADSLAAGDLAGPGSEGPEPLDIYSVINVDVLGAAGQPLSFSAGQRAQVSFLLPDESMQAVGDVLPLYTIDQATGLWEESSSCTVQAAARPVGDRNLECVGSVEHFSAVAAGLNRNRYKVCANVTLKLARAFIAPSFLQIWRVAVSASYSDAWEEKAGEKPGGTAPLGKLKVSWLAPKRIEKELVQLLVFHGGTKSKSTVATGNKAFRIPVGLDGTCPNTTIYYDPTTSEFGLDAPPPAKPRLVDMDGDGFYAGSDCDDNDRTIYPGARSVACSAKDHNCDGRPDLTSFGPTLAAWLDTTWNSRCPVTKMQCPEVLTNEVLGNRRDEDCDGFASDGDGDGYFAVIDPKRAASGKPSDCHDQNAATHPGATEVPGNAFDENCDGLAADQDGDGFPSALQLALEGKSQTTTGVDCNDFNKAVHPGSGVKDFPVLAQFYAGNRRRASFCSLFDSMGKPRARLLNLFFDADRNCNGVLEDLDGDGKLVAAAGTFTNTPPFDANDLDPRISTKDQTASMNDSTCTPDLNNFGAGSREVCPRLFNREQQCVDTYSEGVATGEFACGSPEWDTFSIPPTPFGFGEQYGPCSTMVLPDCGTQLLCGGPIRFAPWYQDALKNSTPAYDVTSESFTGFCMPGCDEVGN